jgi:hypothetical protein
MLKRPEQIIDGFAFYNRQDAELARQEHLKIAYLESHMDMEDAPPEDVLTIYKRAIQERLFKTPVGISYLKHLNSYLLMQPEIETDRIPPIPLYLHYSTTENENRHQEVEHIQADEIEDPKYPDQSQDVYSGEEISDEQSELQWAESEDNNQRADQVSTKLKRAYLLPIMIAVNILLVLIILYMFIIAINSNQPNILNYQRVLQNRYASWEQELSQREQTIRDKERELSIE